MAKQKTLQLAVVENEKDVKPTPPRQFGPDDILEELEELQSRGAEISGRLYRVDNPQDPPTAQRRLYLRNVDGPVYDDYLAENFGGGVYKGRYKARTSEGILKRDVTYRIDDVCGAPQNPQAAPQAARIEAPQVVAPQEQKNTLGALLEWFTADRLTAFGLSIKALKELFAPTPTPAPDYMRLIEILAANGNKSASDTILAKCLEEMGKTRQTPTILQQIKELQAVKEAVKDETENQEESGENMNILIKAALEYLPTLLKQNQNNYIAAGQQAAQMPMVQNIIRDDPGLAQQFITAAEKRFGTQAALQLAQGFGYNAAYVTPQPAPAKQFAPQMPPQGGEEYPEENEENQGD